MKHLTIALIMTLLTSLSALAGNNNCPLTNDSITSSVGALTRTTPSLKTSTGQPTTTTASNQAQR